MKSVRRTYGMALVLIMFVILVLASSGAIAAQPTRIRLSLPLPATGQVSRFAVPASGDRVVYQANPNSPGAQALFSVPAAGGASTMLNDGSNLINNLTLSPDGKWAVYISGGRIMSVPLSGPLERTYTLGGVSQFGTAFKITPDSSAVVYSFPFVPMFGPMVIDLYTVPINGEGQPRRLMSSRGGLIFDFHFDISSDSHYAVVNNGAQLASIPLDGGTLYELSPAAVQQTTFTPDSKAAIYVAGTPSGGKALYGLPLNGHYQDRTLLSGELPAQRTVSMVASSPDSRSAVYVADQEIFGVSELFQVPLTGGTPIKLNAPLAVGQDVLFVTLSPDSTRAVYTVSDGSDMERLFSVPLGGNAPAVDLGVKVARDSGGTPLLWISPDSEYVIIQSLEGSTRSLYSVPLGGGERIPLFTGGNAIQQSVSSKLLFGGADQDQVIFSLMPWNDPYFSALYTVPITGGTPQQLNAPLASENSLLDFALSPDRQRVIYRAEEERRGKAELFAVPLPAAATPPRIAGRVVVEGSGVALPGVRLVLQDGSAALSGNDGRFRLNVASSGVYTVTPQLAGYSFWPPDAVVSVPPSATALNFTALPLGELTVTLKGFEDTSSPGEAEVVVTNPSQASQRYNLTVRAVRLEQGQPVNSPAFVEIWNTQPLAPGASVVETHSLATSLGEPGQYHFEAELMVFVGENLLRPVATLDLGTRDLPRFADVRQRLLRSELDQLTQAAGGELDEIRDIVVGVKSDAYEKVDELVLSAILGPVLDRVAGQIPADEVQREVVTSASETILSGIEQVQSLAEQGVSREVLVAEEVNERLAPVRAAVDSQAQATRARLATHPVVWDEQIPQCVARARSLIASRAEQERVPGIQVPFAPFLPLPSVENIASISVDSLKAQQVAYVQYERISYSVENLTLLIAFFVLCVAVLALFVLVIGSGFTLAGALAAIPAMAQTLLGLGGQVGQVLVTILVVIALITDYQATSSTAPSVAREHQRGVATLTRLATGGAPGLTGVTQLYSPDGRLIAQLDAAPTQPEDLLDGLAPGDYKAVTFADPCGGVAQQAQVMTIVATVPTVDLDVKVSSADAGQPVSVTVVVTNTGITPTGQVAVYAQSADGTSLQGWPLNLGPGAQQSLSYSFTPGATSGYVRASVVTGLSLLAVREAAYGSREASLLSVNVATPTPQTRAGTPFRLGVRVANTGTQEGSTTIITDLVDQSRDGAVVATTRANVMVGGGAVEHADLILAEGLDQPGVYLLRVQADGRFVAAFPVTVTAIDTLYAAVHVVDPVTQVGGTSPFTVTVQSSTFVPADPTVQAVLRRPDGVTETLALQRLEAGHYVGSVTTPISGVYALTVIPSQPRYRGEQDLATLVAGEPAALVVRIEERPQVGQPSWLRLVAHNIYGQPVVGVRVSIIGDGDAIVQTDALGRARLPLVAAQAGVHTVRLEHPGYAPLTMGIAVDMLTRARQHIYLPMVART